MLRVGGLLVRCFAVAAGALAGGCSGIQYLAANVPAAFGAFDRKADIAYGGDARQRLDLYVPDGARERPVVVFWYGGSWQGGSKSHYRFVAAALARRGFVVAVPDYRLFPAVKFPAFMDDAAQALAWVQRNVERHGGDPRRIVLMGHSAGAHIAAYLAFNHSFVSEAGADPLAIRGLIGLSGPYALTPNSSALHSIFSAPYGRADWQPVRFVDERSPPTLLFHGADDRVVEVRHTEALREALESKRVQVEAVILPGRGHADTVAAFALGAQHRAPVLERAARFIESVTSPSAGASGVSGASPASRAWSSSSSASLTKPRPSRGRAT